MAIITVSREMGSGGIPIAHRAAEELGYTLVDGEAIRSVAANYGLTLDAVENADEKPPAFVEKHDEKILVDLHLIEQIVLEYAQRGNVIIYGRGGQDLLNNIDSVLRVRITAPFEERVERWAEREWLDPDLARVLVRKSDQQRSGFIKYYFDRNWKDPINYDLVINTSRLSEDTAVELICAAVKDENLIENKQQSKKRIASLLVRKKAEIAILSSKDLAGQHVALECCDGVLTLGGHVHSQKERNAVLSIVRNIAGVDAIADKLTVVSYRNEPEEH
ncbi:MAG: cytidylate kinase family protein [Desulfuromonadales bacterium]|nr:cytidylate kinase family protein [Desulfuromonadales bacterium]MDT8423285.1 cytidylate kinase family protein [Desulfuromonadales bacterium]